MCIRVFLGVQLYVLICILSFAYVRTCSQTCMHVQAAVDMAAVLRDHFSGAEFFCPLPDPPSVYELCTCPHPHAHAPRMRDTQSVSVRDCVCPCVIVFVCVCLCVYTCTHACAYTNIYIYSM